MKIDRLSDTFTDLEKKQMLKIDELQEKIKLMEFDRIKDNQTIAILKRKLKYRNVAINNAIRNIQLCDVYSAIRVLKNVPMEDENEEN